MDVQGVGIAASQATEGLLQRAAKGDEGAFVALVAEHHGDMRRVAFVVCRDALLAEDAAQDAWHIAWRRLSSVRDEARLHAWLVAIAANEARKLLGRRRRRRVIEGRVTPIEPPGRDPGHEPYRIDLAQALARLEPADRELLALRYVAGLNSFEIARLRGVSASGTRARLARLLARLRTELGDA